MTKVSAYTRFADQASNFKETHWFPVDNHLSSKDEWVDICLVDGSGCVRLPRYRQPGPIEFETTTPYSYS